jgi:ribonuclease BN (tRNA processing enzyme)
MRVQFIGVGEAFDESQSNNSQLLEWTGCRLLIDCGYAVPHALWKRYPDPEWVDAVYLSHRHADHYFGLPSYLIRLMEDERKRPLGILCPEGNEPVIREMIEYGYQGIMAHARFEVVFYEVKAGEPFAYRGAVLEFAPSSHPVKNYAIAVNAEGKRYAYSGDGNFTDHTRRLFHGCNLLVHEAYALDEAVKGHACIPEVLRMAKEEGVERIALTHLDRNVRRNRMAEVREAIQQSGMNAFVPEAGERFEL